MESQLLPLGGKKDTRNSNGSYDFETAGEAEGSGSSPTDTPNRSQVGTGFLSALTSGISDKFLTSYWQRHVAWRVGTQVLVGPNPTTGCSSSSVMFLSVS